MSFHLPNFLRFRARAPKKGPPPKNFVDAFYDPDQGKIIAINDQNEEVEFKSAGEAGAHTHVSEDITDASFGGNGASDRAKLAKFNTVGELSCTYSFSIQEPTGPYKWIFEQGLAITQTRTIKLYNADGFMVLGKPFLDQSAAISGGIQVGDIWFDLTLNKPRVRLV